MGTCEFEHSSLVLERPDEDVFVCGSTGQEPNVVDVQAEDRVLMLLHLLDQPQGVHVVDKDRGALGCIKPVPVQKHLVNGL